MLEKVKKTNEYRLVFFVLLFEAIFLLLCPNFIGNVIVFLSVLNVLCISVVLSSSFRSCYANFVKEKAMSLIGKRQRDNYAKIGFILFLQIIVLFLMIFRFEMSTLTLAIYLFCVLVDIVAVVLETMTISYMLQKARLDMLLRKMSENLQKEYE